MFIDFQTFSYTISRPPYNQAENISSFLLNFGGHSLIDSRPLNVNDFSKDCPPMLYSLDLLDIVSFLRSLDVFDLFNASYSVDDLLKPLFLILEFQTIALAFQDPLMIEMLSYIIDNL